MSRMSGYRPDSRWIRAQRGEKKRVDPWVPGHFFVEEECLVPPQAEPVATIMLTNRECPYTCLMCDLWKNTTGVQVPPRAIPHQIEYALNRLPQAKHIKLYNSGSFFDPGAIPQEEYPGIASLLEKFETVVVESHPRFINERVLAFKGLLRSRLQVAIGLETVHPEVLPRLNKHMDLDDFRHSVSFLRANRVSTRAFVLLRPPFLAEEEGILWAKKSIEHAFETGVDTCVVIPVRAGNGAMEALGEQGLFATPDIKSLEQVLASGISLGTGPVFADLWDIEAFSSCDICFSQRKKRLMEMNLQQKILPEVICSCKK